MVSRFRELAEIIAKEMIGIILVFVFISSQAYAVTDNITDLLSICSYQCFNQVQKLMNNSATLTKHEKQEEKKAGSVCHWYDVEKVQEVCKDVNNGSECLESCGNDKYKAMVKGLYKHGICGEESEIKNFTQHFPCISQNCDDMDKTCQSQCRESSTTDVDLDVIIEVKHDPYMQLDKETTTKRLADACQYLGCHYKCADPIYGQKCGNITSAVLGEVILSSVRVVNDLLTITGRQDEIAPECNNLAELLEGITSRYRSIYIT